MPTEQIWYTFIWNKKSEMDILSLKVQPTFVQGLQSHMYSFLQAL